MIEAKMELITPKMAQKFLATNLGNRKLDDRTVDFYGSQMQKGLWRMNGETIQIDNTGKLLNGQHRLTACVKYNAPFQSLVVTGVDRETFATIDSGRNRSIGDLFYIQGASYSYLIGPAISKYFTYMNGNSAFGNTDRINKRTRGREEILSEYSLHPEFWEDICSYARSIYHKLHLMSQSDVVSLCAYLILGKGHSTEKVKYFFSQLFQNATAENQTIEALRTKLSNDIINRLKMQRTHKACLIAKAWNAYIEGKKLERLTYRPEKEGMVKFK